MADILAFPRPAATQPACEILQAANHAAAATKALCDAKLLLRAGQSRAAVARELDEAGALVCLITAARHTMTLAGGQPGDRFLARALDHWLDHHGGPQS